MNVDEVVDAYTEIGPGPESTLADVPPASRPVGFLARPAFVDPLRWQGDDS